MVYVNALHEHPWAKPVSSECRDIFIVCCDHHMISHMERKEQLKTHSVHHPQPSDSKPTQSTLTRSQPASVRHVKVQTIKLRLI